MKRFSDIVRMAHSVRSVSRNLGDAMMAVSVAMRGLSADHADQAHMRSRKAVCARRRANMERLSAPCQIEGYLLELKEQGEDWIPYEFDYSQDTRFSFDEDWDNAARDKFFELEFFGLYKALPDGVCSYYSDSWFDRNGVDFDARHTPTERPSPIGVWGGVCDPEHLGSRDCLWRVTRVTIDGALRDKVVKFLADNI